MSKIDAESACFGRPLWVVVFAVTVMLLIVLSWGAAGDREQFCLLTILSVGVSVVIAPVLEPALLLVADIAAEIWRALKACIRVR